MAAAASGTPGAMMAGAFQRIATRMVSEERAGLTFVLFLLLHAVLWSLLPGLTRHELDSDSMMHFAWGQEWQWSYRLHPPLQPWVVAGFLNVFGINNAAYVVLSQVNIVLAFIAIWFLARQFLSAPAALAAVCVLEFIPYYSFFSQRFNHSGLLISLWAFTTLFAYFALHRQRLLDWILLGLFAAASMLCKYYSVTLLTAIALVFLCSTQGRSTLRTWGPYIALTLFSTMMILHVQLVLSDRIGTIHHIGDYFDIASLAWRWQPIKFFLAQLLYVAPAVIVFLVATRNHQARCPWYVLFSRGSWDHSNRMLYVVTFFPLLVTALPGIVLGVAVSSRWGAPLLGMAGILLIMQCPGTLSVEHYRRIVVAAFAWAIFLPLLILTAHGFGWVTNDAVAFPGKELAATITERWHAHHQTPLRVVGGGRVTPDSIAFHSLDHPSALQNLNFSWSPWVTPGKIRRHGMAVVCLASDDECIKRANEWFPSKQWISLAVTGVSSRFARVIEADVRYFFIAPGQYEITQ
ncbi:MAG: glycosyltransferase family 39 protein [Pseudomonadota bacterium]|nr:glycosyltransferase family 39 protein [Pseudomonadota bacterium]